MERLARKEIKLLLKVLSLADIDLESRIKLETKLEKMLDEFNGAAPIKFRLPKERS